VPFGHDEMLLTIARRPDATAREACDRLIAAVARHRAGAVQHDDMTLVVVRALI
jgi:serine phosphatase RsbU (regulator of sigma subunit)